jgi:hypothetical protein
VKEEELEGMESPPKRHKKIIEGRAAKGISGNTYRATIPTMIDLSLQSYY